MKEIKISKNQIALVDDEDFELVNKYSWQAFFHRNSYYARTGRSGSIQHPYTTMHRLILNTTCSIIDHVDHNGLNNQKSNLRECTANQNMQNRVKHMRAVSVYKGVTYKKDRDKWQTRISVNGNRITLGDYDSEELAALMYNLAAVKYFNTFACINNLSPQYTALFHEVNSIITKDNNHEICTS